MANWSTHLKIKDHPKKSMCELKKDQAPMKPKVTDWLKNLKDFLTKKLGSDMASQIFAGEVISQTTLYDIVAEKGWRESLISTYYKEGKKGSSS